MAYVDEVEFQAPPRRRMSPARRNLLVRGGLVLLLVAALVAAGWYWRSNADERALSRYHKQLPAAEAAWPAAAQWLSTVQPPAGWHPDATFSACGFERVPVVCFDTPYDDPAQAASAAQRWLVGAGAETKDTLMNTFLASVQAHRVDVLGCSAVAGLCTADVSWHGTSVGIRALTGESSVGQHVSVAIGRGYGFPEANEPPKPQAVLLGKSPADLTRLTGLGASFGTVQCKSRTAGSCTHWYLGLSTLLAPVAARDQLARALAAHGFRLANVANRDNGDFKHILAYRYLGAGGRDAVMALAVVRVGADGLTTGDVNVVGMLG